MELELFEFLRTITDEGVEPGASTTPADVIAGALDADHVRLIDGKYYPGRSYVMQNKFTRKMVVEFDEQDLPTPPSVEVANVIHIGDGGLVEGATATVFGHYMSEPIHMTQNQRFIAVIVVHDRCRLELGTSGVNGGVNWNFFTAGMILSEGSYLLLAHSYPRTETVRWHYRILGVPGSQLTSDSADVTLTC